MEARESSAGSLLCAAVVRKRNTKARGHQRMPTADADATKWRRTGPARQGAASLLLMEQSPISTCRASQADILPRVCLVVPASDRRKMAKAFATEADEVVVDLEDAVAPAAKQAARANVVELLVEVPDRALAVRVNEIGSAWCHSDVLDVSCAVLDKVTLVIPKVNSAADVGFIDRLVNGALAGRSGRLPDIRMDVLIETAAALRNIDDILSASDRVRAVVVGYGDLGADLGIDFATNPPAADAVRHQIVAAARASKRGLVDGPWLAIAADDAFTLDRERSRSFGFDGCWVIHPAQVPAATRIFTPSAAEVAWAHRVVTALEGAIAKNAGAIALDGQMLDEAVAKRARSVLARARKLQ